MTQAKRLPVDWFPIESIPLGTITAGTPVTGRECRLYGWSFVETTGTDPAELVVYDGGSAGGTPVVHVTLDAGQSTRDYPPKPGLRIQSGIWVEIVSGSVDVIIQALLLSEEEIWLMAQGD